jgi:transcriptional regulator with XRE-family HTH domain
VESNAQEEVTPVVLNVRDKETVKAIACGIGEELRRRREAQDASRARFVQRLSSGIGERTLLAYEHGLRQISVIRLIELSEVLEVGAPILLNLALQRAKVTLQNIPLRVDLSKLLEATYGRMQPLRQWAKNRLGDSENGVIEVMPAGVRELAASVGFRHEEVARHLAKFIPEG